jgi:hypothetical protein
MAQEISWKKKKLFFVFSILLILWVSILLILGCINQRTVVFYDTLALHDVSSEYSSELPFLRYLIEPIVAITFILEWEFTWLISFLLFYPIIRGIYKYLRYRGKLQSEKFSYLLKIFSEILKFSFKIFSVVILMILGFIIVGYIFQGFFFVSRYFMVPVQIGVHLAYTVILIKILYIVICVLHPKLTLKLKSKHEHKKRKKQKNLQKFIFRLKTEIIYIVAFVYLLLGMNIILISFKLPNQIIRPIIPLADDEFLFDFHVHTTMSDGWLTPEERVLWYIEQGISGAVFSDHDNLRGVLIAQEYVERNNLDFIVFIGEEWTDHENDIHMNYFGLEEEIVPLESYTIDGPKAMNASDLITYVKSNGGYITVNHYNYDPNDGGYGVPYTLTQLYNWGVDGFEIVNGGSYYGKYEQIRQFCLSNNLICIGGSDIHINEDLNTFIKIKLSDPTNLTIANIFETMKANTHEVIAIQFYPELVNFPGELNDLGFYFLEGLINYFLNINIFQALAWIGWSIFFYIFIVLGYRRMTSIDLGKIKQKIH